jgi:hypothetical protein
VHTLLGLGIYPAFLSKPIRVLQSASVYGPAPSFHTEFSVADPLFPSRVRPPAQQHLSPRGGRPPAASEPQAPTLAHARTTGSAPSLDGLPFALMLPNIARASSVPADTVVRPLEDLKSEGSVSDPPSAVHTARSSSTAALPAHTVRPLPVFVGVLQCDSGALHAVVVEPAGNIVHLRFATPPPAAVSDPGPTAARAPLWTVHDVTRLTGSHCVDQYSSVTCGLTPNGHLDVAAVCAGIPIVFSLCPAAAPTAPPFWTAVQIVSRGPASGATLPASLSLVKGVRQAVMYDTAGHLCVASPPSGSGGVWSATPILPSIAKLGRARPPPSCLAACAPGPTVVFADAQGLLRRLDRGLMGYSCLHLLPPVSGPGALALSAGVSGGPVWAELGPKQTLYLVVRGAHGDIVALTYRSASKLPEDCTVLTTQVSAPVPDARCVLAVTRLPQNAERGAPSPLVAYVAHHGQSLVALYMNAAGEWSCEHLWSSPGTALKSPQDALASQLAAALEESSESLPDGVGVIPEQDESLVLAPAVAASTHGGAISLLAVGESLLSDGVPHALVFRGLPGRFRLTDVSIEVSHTSPVVRGALSPTAGLS